MRRFPLCHLYNVLFCQFRLPDCRRRLKFEQTRRLYFSAHEKICKCFLPEDEGRRLLRFSAVQSCVSVKENLRNLVYGVSVLFGVGFVISMVTAVASSWMLYAEQRKSMLVRVFACYFLA